MSGGVATLSASAKASKTWVLPPRAKPGRKSKKVAEAAAQADNDNDESEMYKATSRTKQKASRERKQEYIAELEAKLRTYEQGEGERASFFQDLAKKHSAENDALRAENEELKRRIAALEAAGSSDLGRTTLVTLPSLVRKPSSDLPSRPKRQRTRSGSVSSSSSSSHATAIFLPASANIDPVATWSNFQPHARQKPANPTSQSRSPASSYLPPSLPVSSRVSPVMATSAHTTFAAHNSDGCGFCETIDSGSCLCEDIGLPTKRTVRRPADPGSIEETSRRHDSSCNTCGSTNPLSCMCRDPDTDGDRKVSIASCSSEKASCGLCTDHGDCLCEDLGLGRPHTSTDMKVDIQASSMPLPLPNYPGSSSGSFFPSSGSDMKAVPLKLRSRSSTSTSTKGKIWRIDNLLPDGKQSSVPKPANTATAAAGVALRRKLIKVGSRLPCTGDPSSCPACADDPVGQAFCSALSNTVCQSGTPCATCPNRPSPLANEVSVRSKPSTEEQQTRIELRRKDSSARDEVPSAMIPCSDAWATLREHPNIGYANLDMLASVVAKRTTCHGESRDSDGKIITVQREGLEEALDLLDHVKEQEERESVTPK